MLDSIDSDRVDRVRSIDRFENAPNEKKATPRRRRAINRGDARRRTRARVTGANVSGESNARRCALSRDAR